MKRKCDNLRTLWDKATVKRTLVGNLTSKLLFMSSPLYPSIRKVLNKIGEEYRTAEAIGAQTMLTSFEFVFMLHLLQEIFGYSDALCNALQRRQSRHCEFH